MKKNNASETANQFIWLLLVLQINGKEGGVCSDGLPVQFSNSLATVTFDAARENRHVHQPATRLS